MLFRGLVRLNVNTPPWKILLTSKGVNISSSGILVQFDNDSICEQLDLVDIHYLLTEGDEVGVQLEHQDIDLPIAYLPATVVRKKIINDYLLEVGLMFRKSTDELKSLIHEIHQN